MELINPKLEERRGGRFSFFLAPASQVKPWRTMGLAEVHRYLTTNMDALRQTHRLRECCDEKERRLLKRRCFAFATFSGIFSYRADAALVEHSGLMCLDFDHVGNVYQLQHLRERLLADPMLRTRLLFTSPSGDGLKWVVDIDLGVCDHMTWFRGIANYVAHTYRQMVDEKCCNLSRSCFLPHDANAYVDVGEGQVCKP